MMDEVSVTDCSVNPVDLACMQIGQKLQRIFQWKQFAVMFTLRGRDKIFDKCTVFFYCIETQKLLIEILSNRKSCQIKWDTRLRSRHTTADERLSVGESKKTVCILLWSINVLFPVGGEASMPDKRIWSKWDESPDALTRRCKPIYCSSNVAFRL